MKNSDVVTYDNEINNLDFDGFKASDMDLFMAFCLAIKDQGTKRIEVSYSRLMETAGYRHATIEELHEYLKKPFRQKIFGLSFGIDTEEEYNGWVLFDHYSANKSKKILTLEVSEKAERFFNNLLGNFTAFDMAVYSNLKSRYSKLLYQHLCQFRNPKTRSGFWDVPLEDGKSEGQPIGFRTIMNVPKGLVNKRIKDDIINPSVQELAPYMKIEVTVKRGSSKGRPVEGYRFDFWEVKQNVIDMKPKDEEVDLENIDGICNAVGLGKNSVKTILREAEKANLSVDQVVELIEKVKSMPNIKSVGAFAVYCIQNELEEPKKSTGTNKNTFTNFGNQRKYSSEQLLEIEKRMIEQSKVKK